MILISKTKRIIRIFIYISEKLYIFKIMHLSISIIGKSGVGKKSLIELINQ